MTNLRSGVPRGDGGVEGEADEAGARAGRSVAARVQARKFAGLRRRCIPGDGRRTIGGHDRARVAGTEEMAVHA